MGEQQTMSFQADADFVSLVKVTCKELGISQSEFFRQCIRKAATDEGVFWHEHCRKLVENEKQDTQDALKDLVYFSKRITRTKKAVNRVKALLGEQEQQLISMEGGLLKRLQSKMALLAVLNTDDAAARIAAVEQSDEADATEPQE